MKLVKNGMTLAEIDQARAVLDRMAYRIIQQQQKQKPVPRLHLVKDIS